MQPIKTLVTFKTCVISWYLIKIFFHLESKAVYISSAKKITVNFKIVTLNDCKSKVMKCNLRLIEAKSFFFFSGQLIIFCHKHWNYQGFQFPMWFYLWNCTYSYCNVRPSPPPPHNIIIRTTVTWSRSKIEFIHKEHLVFWSVDL